MVKEVFPGKALGELVLQDVQAEKFHARDASEPLFGGFDEVPEFGVFLQSLVFPDLDAGAKEEILQCVPAQNAVDEHAERMPLKINPVVADAEAVEDVAGKVLAGATRSTKVLQYVEAGEAF